eukprot:m.690001 g.690001  ORF g.690001 m.690001 type:complete len:272 (-) comp22848_c0_seq3:1872-2687(-)
MQAGLRLPCVFYAPTRASSPLETNLNELLKYVCAHAVPNRYRKVCPTVTGASCVSSYEKRWVDSVRGSGESRCWPSDVTKTLSYAEPSMAGAGSVPLWAAGGGSASDTASMHVLLLARVARDSARGPPGLLRRMDSGRGVHFVFPRLEIADADPVRCRLGMRRCTASMRITVHGTRDSATMVSACTLSAGAHPQVRAPRHGSTTDWRMMGTATAKEAHHAQPRVPYQGPQSWDACWVRVGCTRTGYPSLPRGWCSQGCRDPDASARVRPCT